MPHAGQTKKGNGIFVKDIIFTIAYDNDIIILRSISIGGLSHRYDWKKTSNSDRNL
jgi:hypothetical protein